MSASNSRMYIEEVGLQPLNIPIEHSECEANQLHDVHNILIHITDGNSPGLRPLKDDWNFIPHKEPLRRIMEGSSQPMKHHLRWTLGAQIATYKELCTLLAQIEACLNSRPLWALSDDPLNPTYLSPGHFLIGEPITQLPDADITNVKYNRLSRWQSFQQELQQFWQRWSADYLQNLHQRRRWMKTNPNTQSGALILLREDNTTLQWPTAVVTNVHLGKDGIVRVVTIRTPKGEFKRPITKICPLPCESDDPYCKCFLGLSVCSHKGKFCVFVF
jgi:hypothetical protein